MSLIWTGINNTLNATCINIDELKDVVIISFITQLVSTIIIVVSTTVICITYWQPLCCRKNRISPDELAEIIERYREIQINQSV